MSKIAHYACSVIPPHILRHIAEHAESSERSVVDSTLAQMEQLNGDRGNRFIDTVPDRNEIAPATAGKRRHVYDAGHRQSLPGKLALSEKKGRSTDSEVNEAWDGAGATYDFYARVFGRNSIDDRGLRIDSTVHYGVSFDNALWNGRQMIYGDGDGKLFNRFTSSLDVIGHELTHGVTEHTAALEYAGQAGALNEHVSDAFGIMVKQYTLGQTAAQSDWLIGAGLLTDGVKGKAVRSMAAPGTAYDDPVLGRDPQPSNMHHYQHTSSDNGGVHINSGIPNHAFYLAAIAIGGQTWIALGKIWYVTLTTKLSANVQFAEFAAATLATAGELYGRAGQIQRIVQEAWAEVGIPVLLPTSSARLPIRQQTNSPLECRAGVVKWRDRPLR